MVTYRGHMWRESHLDLIDRTHPSFTSAIIVFDRVNEHDDSSLECRKGNCGTELLRRC